jgi:hypothetical protein
MQNAVFRKLSSSGSKAVSNEVFWIRLFAKRIFGRQFLEKNHPVARDQNANPAFSVIHLQFI